MHLFRSVLLPVLLAGAMAEAATDATAVEAAVKALFEAIHRGDADAVRALYSKEGKLYLPGGAEVDANPVGISIIGRRKDCALYVRHVQMTTADSAYVAALWRCPEAAPPGDSGMLDLTLRREAAGWRLMSWREGLLRGVARLKPEGAAAESPQLTREERAEGWFSLFDGKSFRGWASPTGEDAPSNWRILDGALATVPGGPVRPSLRTREEFTNFELRFEWLVHEKANSGCIYRLFTVGEGMEYQVADDQGDPGALVDPRQRAGALYGVTPVLKSVARPVGEWNTARIRVTRERIEHWLNGVRTAEFAVDVPLPSPIVLQYHSTEVKFRNLVIRRLP